MSVYDVFCSQLNCYSIDCTTSQKVDNLQAYTGPFNQLRVRPLTMSQPSKTYPISSQSSEEQLWVALVATVLNDKYESIIQYGESILVGLIDSGDTAKVMRLINAIGPDHPLVTRANNYGQTPLHWAAVRGLGEIVDMLYTIYAKSEIHLARSNTDGYTFFNLLIHCNHHHIIQKLLEREDFDQRLISVPDNNNAMPMLYAVRGSHTEICELLYPISVSTGSITKAYHEGCNILMAAISMNLLSVVQLLTSEPSVCLALFVGNDKGYGPLHYAVQESSLEICALICERSTIEHLCLQVKHTGRTALHEAVLYRSVCVIEVLLKDHIKAIMAVRDADGMTAMDYARLRSPEIVAIIQAAMDA